MQSDSAMNRDVDVIVTEQMRNPEWKYTISMAIMSTKRQNLKKKMEAANVTSWGCDVEWDALSVAKHPNHISIYNYINVHAKR